MKIDKNYITKLITEEYEKIVLSELFSKRPANLEEIMDADQNPSISDVMKSDHFQESLFHDLVDNKKNISDWRLMQKAGSFEDVNSTNDDSFPVEYDFDFTYNYKETPFHLSLFLKGSVPVKWSGSYRSATHYQPAEYPEADIDPRYFGNDIDIHLFDNDGQEIQLRRLDGKAWMTPQIKKAVANAVLSPYL